MFNQGFSPVFAVPAPGAAHSAAATWSTIASAPAPVNSGLPCSADALSGTQPRLQPRISAARVRSRKLSPAGQHRPVSTIAREGGTQPAVIDGAGQSHRAPAGAPSRRPRVLG